MSAKHRVRRFCAFVPSTGPRACKRPGRCYDSCVSANKYLRGDLVSRTPLVLVHGNPETAAIWGPLIGELDRADAVVLSPPGFGVPAPRGGGAAAAAGRDGRAAQRERF